MTYILIIISLFLDGAISTIISQNSYLIPHLLLTTLFIIYPKYKKRNVTYNMILIITGILYDLLYTNLLFFHAIVFLIVGIIIKYLYKNYNQSTIINVFSLITVIAIYIALISISMLMFKTTNIIISDIINFIIRSLFINILYLLLLNPIVKNKA